MCYNTHNYMCMHYMDSNFIIKIGSFLAQTSLEISIGLGQKFYPQDLNLFQEQRLRGG